VTSFFLSLADKFLNSFCLEHLADVKIAMPVGPETVRRRKHSYIQRALERIAPACEQLPIQVENTDASLELGDIHDSIAVHVDLGWLDKSAPFVEVLTLWREYLDPVVVAVADEDPPVCLPHAVWTIELART